MVERRRRGKKPTDDDLRLGKELRTLRKPSDVSQENLAQYLKVSAQQISKYETGRNRMSAGVRERALAFIRKAEERKRGDPHASQRGGFEEQTTTYIGPLDQDRSPSPNEIVKTLEDVVARLKRLFPPP